MLVSFTLVPMLSSRFLKLADAEADHKTKEQDSSTGWTRPIRGR
jgi:multidrug efflux pump subunit AcrB